MNYFFLFNNLILLQRHVYVYISNFIFKFERVLLILLNVKSDKNEIQER